jgi:hypothetical protein
MQWVIVIVACLVIGGWMFNALLGGREQAAQVRAENSGRYSVGLIVFAVIAFFLLALLGTLTGRH